MQEGGGWEVELEGGGIKAYYVLLELWHLS